jgi:hypothetical protein
VFQKQPDLWPLLPTAVRRALWAALAADVASAVWMLTAGDWLDRYSPITAAATLGGHHLVVLWLGVGAAVLLGVLATLTAGFAWCDRTRAVGLAAAGVASVVVVAGALSVAVLLVGTVLLAAVVGRAFVR